MASTLKLKRKKNHEPYKDLPKEGNLEKIDYTKIHDDIWNQIFHFLDLKSIYNIEMVDVFFQNVLKRIKFWKRRIRSDFPHCDSEIPDVNEEESYFLARKLYWIYYRLNHACNICRLCCVDICEEIPECEWKDYLD